MGQKIAPYLPTKAYCLAEDYEAVHPGYATYKGKQCGDCVPVVDYELIRYFLIKNPERVNDPAVPGLLGVSPKIYARVVAYFRSKSRM